MVNLWKQAQRREAKTYQHPEQHVFRTRAWDGRVNDVEDRRFILACGSSADALAVRRHGRMLSGWRRRTGSCKKGAQASLTGVQIAPADKETMYVGGVWCCGGQMGWNGGVVRHHMRSRKRRSDLFFCEGNFRRGTVAYLHLFFGTVFVQLNPPVLCFHTGFAAPHGIVKKQKAYFRRAKPASKGGFFFVPLLLLTGLSSRTMRGDLTNPNDACVSRPKSLTAWTFKPSMWVLMTPRQRCALDVSRVSACSRGQAGQYVGAPSARTLKTRTYARL